MGLNQITIIIGCLNAIVFSGVLFSSKTNVKSNVFLSILILSLALNLGLSWALSLGLFDKYIILHVLPFGISFGLGPLIYLYTLSLCSIKKINYYHLLFFIADYPHNIYHLILGRNTESQVHEFLDKLSFFALIIIVFYLWKSWKVISKHQIDLKNNVSNISNQTLNWLKSLVIVFIVSIPVFLILWIILIKTGLEFNDRFIGYAYYTFAIFWLGIGGIRQQQLIATNRVETSTINSKKAPVNNERIEALIYLMEVEKLFLYPNLDIRMLESKLNLSAKQISEILNAGLGKNFYRFINEYRVEEFKKKVKSNTNLTLYGVALESGFNSKATFQRVFKEISGIRPSEFISGNYR